MPWCEKTAGEKTLRPSCCNPQFLNSQLNYPVPKREAVHRTLQREPLASGRPFLKQVAQVLHQISPIFEPASISCNDLPRIEYIQRIQAFLMLSSMNICQGPSNARAVLLSLPQFHVHRKEGRHGHRHRHRPFHGRMKGFPPKLHR